MREGKAKEVELEDVVVLPDGNGAWLVKVVKLRGVPLKEKSLESGVSLPVARYAARLWRAKADALERGLP